MDKNLSDGGTATDGIQILVSYALWGQWGEIAVEREGTARAARAELVAQHRHGQEPAPAMLTELLASMVAISAAAHALDALYGAAAALATDGTPNVEAVVAIAQRHGIELLGPVPDLVGS